MILGLLNRGKKSVAYKSLSEEAGLLELLLVTDEGIPQPFSAHELEDYDTRAAKYKKNKTGLEQAESMLLQEYASMPLMGLIAKLDCLPAISDIPTLVILFNKIDAINSVIRTITKQRARKAIGGNSESYDISAKTVRDELGGRAGIVGPGNISHLIEIAPDKLTLEAALDALLNVHKAPDNFFYGTLLQEAREALTLYDARHNDHLVRESQLKLEESELAALRSPRRIQEVYRTGIHYKTVLTFDRKENTVRYDADVRFDFSKSNRTGIPLGHYPYNMNDTIRQKVLIAVSDALIDMEATVQPEKSVGDSQTITISQRGGDAPKGAIKFSFHNYRGVAYFPYLTYTTQASSGQHIDALEFTGSVLPVLGDSLFEGVKQCLGSNGKR